LLIVLTVHHLLIGEAVAAVGPEHIVELWLWLLLEVGELSLEVCGLHQ